MSTLLALNKIIAPRISGLGFEYAGKPDSISWVFSRSYKEATQYITFEKIGANPDCIRFNLTTSVSREKLSHYQLDMELDPVGVVYSNQESLYKVLEVFAYNIINGGIDWLNIMSKPDVSPSKELYAAFAESLNCRTFTIPEHIYSSDDFIEQLQMSIQERSCDGTAPLDWEFIMNAAFELGEAIRRRFTGEWLLFESTPCPFVMNIAGKSDLKINPLWVISNYWGKPQYIPYSIVGRFNRISRKMY
ncbi:hypothetical protein GZH47_30185 [Paenibacillus rhizovicinus]|uniref:Uncharacterized protein n=1 Tax=Paenibacillus rhizovicinus TaxID=2704463 RepID=A0A6C0PCI2_9BACL|nr:hypothetical protein [Paenibacillus rhizovicinus]QHW34642.1 hypothetical protein GZH47_30185 [Paenibacillus rhizovicinus]